MALKSILIATLMFLAASGPAAAGWITEIIQRVGIQRAGDGGSWSSLAIDANDRVHVSYYHVVKRDLRYALRTGGGWSSRIVDRPGDVGWSNALALNAFGEPHIAYSDSTRYTISFAFQKPSGKFRNIPITNNLANGGSAPSLIFDSTNRYHIIHHNFNTGSLEYLARSARGDAGWDHAVLSSQTQVGSSSLAVGLGDTLHVAHMYYCPPPSFDCGHPGAQQWVVHLSNTGPNGAWETEFVRPVGSEGISSSSIAVDAQGAVHIVYADRTDGSLNYETNASGLWKPRVLYNQSWVSKASMKIDVRGHLHVSYTLGQGPDGTTLKYATNSSGVWVHEVVDDARSIGDVTSIAIDRFGQPHISYYDATRGNLRHAVRQ